MKKFILCILSIFMLFTSEIKANNEIDINIEINKKEITGGESIYYAIELLDDLQLSQINITVVNETIETIIQMEYIIDNIYLGVLQTKDTFKEGIYKIKEIEFIDENNKHYIQTKNYSHCDFYLYDEYKHIDFNQEKITLHINETYQIKPNIYSSKKETITYESIDPNIAQINEQGIITPISKGTTKINAYLPIGKYATIECTITDIDQETCNHEYNEEYFIDIPSTITTKGIKSKRCIYCHHKQENSEITTPLLSKISLNIDQLIFVVDNTRYLNVYVDNKAIHNSELVWESLDENIASVDYAGTITAVSEGITYIKISKENCEPYLLKTVVCVHHVVLTSGQTTSETYASLEDIDVVVKANDDQILSVLKTDEGIAIQDGYGIFYHEFTYCPHATGKTYVELQSDGSILENGRIMVTTINNSIYLNKKVNSAYSFKFKTFNDNGLTLDIEKDGIKLEVFSKRELTTVQDINTNETATQYEYQCRLTFTKEGRYEFNIVDYDGYPILEGNRVIINDPSYTVGDVNNDNEVNSLDRVYLTRYLAKWKGYEDINLQAADVNKNGTVNAEDRMILTRYLAKWSYYYLAESY